MSRLTISISDDMHRALKGAAVRQGRSITPILNIDTCLMHVSRIAYLDKEPRTRAHTSHVYACL